MLTVSLSQEGDLEEVLTRVTRSHVAVRPSADIKARRADAARAPGVEGGDGVNPSFACLNPSFA